MKRKPLSIPEIVREAALAGETLDDAEIYRRAGLNPDDFYQGEEAAARFAVGCKCLFRGKDKVVLLTPEEEAVRQDIIRTIDRANPGMRYGRQRVGGNWGEDK